MIIDDNVQYAEELSRQFVESGLFEVLPIVTISENAIGAFRELRPDIAIIDMIMPRMDGIEILRVLNERNAIGSAMIFATTPFYLDASIVQKAIDMGVTYFFYKPIDALSVFSHIIDTINAKHGLPGRSLMTQKEIDLKIEEWIVNYMRLLGIGAHLKGYEYIKCATAYCVNHSGRIPAISTELFPYVAIKYNTTWKSVDRNIRTAIEYAWNHGNVEAQHKLFGYTVNSHSGAPTCKEFVAMLCERIIMRIKQI